MCDAHLEFIPDVGAIHASGPGAVYDYIRNRGYATPNDVYDNIHIIHSSDTAPAACEFLYKRGFLDRTAAVADDADWTYFPAADPPLPAIQQIRVTG